MIILKFASDLNTLVQKLRDCKSSIGFVPTMGALHKGHVSLVEKSKTICDKTICSIFINPTQFNNADDFKKYPITLEQDIYMLEKNGCDILFLPSVSEIYPDITIQQKHFDLGDIETILEGKYRPGHFQGVCQVVSRLLKIITPTHLFLGQKDYQQTMVINKLIQLEKLNIKLVICPTLREENGLAMSSRNNRLNKEQLNKAPEIYKTLLSLKQKIRPGSLQDLKKEAELNLISKNFKPDYIEIADSKNLHPVKDWDGISNLVILAAAFLGDVRLIDNILLKD